jgi:kumamolisin
MKRSGESLVAVVGAVLMFGFETAASAQESNVGSPIGVSESGRAAPVHIPSAQGTLVIPSSSIPQTTVVGQPLTAHTNIEIFMPHGVTPEEAPPFTGLGYETPASLACVYLLVTQVAGCDPYSTTANPTGGSKTIAIVDAYDDYDAPSDLAWFSLQFGLPLTLSQFEVVQAVTADSSCFASGVVPIDPTGGWELEESLDVQWSHAMAPGANIYLVEACSSLDGDLQQAILVANNLVQCGQTEIDPTTGALGTCPAGSTGTGEVSMSWGEGEYTGENASTCVFNSGVYGEGLADGCFTTPGVVYLASTGDTPGVEYPSVSPNVVAAGGLTIRRNPANFSFMQETGWVDAGGGSSAIEARPSYQNAISSIVGSFRGVPDLSFDADPYSGVYVYDTFPINNSGLYTWWVVGGTSVAAPSLAGIINNAATRSGTFAASSNAELTTIYANRSVTTDFFDITSAYCGPYMGFTAVVGWDFCTGVGADNGYVGK